MTPSVPKIPEQDEVMTLDNKAFQSHLIKIISVPVVLIVLLLTFSHFQNRYRDELRDDIELFDSVILDTVKLQKNFSDMESGIRGYAISGRGDFLAPYRKAKTEVAFIQERVFKAVVGEYELTKLFRSLGEKFDVWERHTAEVIAARSLGEEKAEGKVTSGADHFVELRALVNDFSVKILGFRDDRVKKLGRIKTITNSLEIIFALIFVLFLSFLITRQLKNLIRSYRKLIAMNNENMREIEKASRAKDLFLANMSHEIRTPLGAIMGFADLSYQDPSLSPETRSHISFIRRNSKHLLSLIDDLFDLSKVSVDKIEVEKADVDLQNMVVDVDDLFSSKMVDKSIELSVKVQTRIPKIIQTDPVRFKQILSNLIGNAIKFSPSGSRVDVIFSHEKDMLFVDIIDQGIGIKEEDQRTIFDAFIQADSNHSRNFGGAGLGLSISKKLAKILGGDVELVSSRVNIGSHFRFTLPISIDDAEFIDRKAFDLTRTSETFETVIENNEVNKTDLSGKRILLAEDSKENQILFKIFLEPSHAELTIVDNGTDAIRSALGNDYDLILMDIQMPGLDGYEALKILRGSNYNRSVIALTAHTMKGEKEKCLQAGFDRYLSKPVSQKTLLATICDTLEA